jgi:hypothetical protein
MKKRILLLLALIAGVLATAAAAWAGTYYVHVQFSNGSPATNSHVRIWNSLGDEFVGCDTGGGADCTVVGSYGGPYYIAGETYRCPYFYYSGQQGPYAEGTMNVTVTLSNSTWVGC